MSSNMIKLAISKILENASKLKGDQAKAEYLQQNATPVLYDILRGIFDPNIKWDLPDGDPPYKPCSPAETDGKFYSEARKLYLFVEGNNLKPYQRESLFVQFLESIHPEDAKMILSMKDKKSPYKGITRNVVDLAFPGLIPNEQVVQA